MLFINFNRTSTAFLKTSFELSVRAETTEVSISTQLCSHVEKAEDPFCIISWRPSLDIISPLEALITITAGIPRTPKAEFNCLKSRN